MLALAPAEKRHRATYKLLEYRSPGFATLYSGPSKAKAVEHMARAASYAPYFSRRIVRVSNGVEHTLFRNQDQSGRLVVGYDRVLEHYKNGTLK